MSLPILLDGSCFGDLNGVQTSFPCSEMVQCPGQIPPLARPPWEHCPAAVITAPATTVPAYVGPGTPPVTAPVVSTPSISVPVSTTVIVRDQAVIAEAPVTKVATVAR